MSAELAESDAADEAPTRLLDLPDEVLECVCASLAEDLCAGVTTLVRLSCVSVRFHVIVSSHGNVERCAEAYGIAVPANVKTSHRTLELLSVLETVSALGTNRIQFQRGKGSYDSPVIRPGSSMPRLIEFALLLRRHPALTVAIEGHEHTKEGIVHDDDAGSRVRASFGSSVRRAEAVREALLSFECLERLGRAGNKVWGKLAKPRFAERITRCHGWEDAVAEAAGWTSLLECCHVELFFTFDGVEVPKRGAHYLASREECERSVGWQQHFAGGFEQLQQ